MAPKRKHGAANKQDTLTEDQLRGKRPRTSSSPNRQPVDSSKSASLIDASPISRVVDPSISSTDALCSRDDPNTCSGACSKNDPNRKTPWFGTKVPIFNGDEKDTNYKAYWTELTSYFNQYDAMSEADKVKVALAHIRGTARTLIPNDVTTLKEIEAGVSTPVLTSTD